MPPNEVNTFYDILGVSKDASQEDLRKAWLALARKHHPDKTGGHKGSEEKLKRINEAYDTLKRPEKRREYDEMLSGTYKAGGPFDGGPSRQDSPYKGFARSEHSEFDTDYASFFSDLFGQQARGNQRSPQRGRDLEAQASVSLKEAATGTRKTFRVPFTSVCQACSGSGAAPGTRPQQCPQCKGAGRIFGDRGSLFIMSQVCPLCRGQGEIIAAPCPTCGGSGLKTDSHALSIRIPAGVRTGTRLRLAGQGEPGEPGGPAGDLLIMIEVEESALFQRKRNDLLCDVPITFTQATLGGAIEVPTLKGTARLTIPAGTQTGAVLRMRGQGFPPFKGGKKGDQLVRVMVEIPRNITKDQRDAIQKLHEPASLEAYPRHQKFAEALRQWRQTE